MDREQLQSFGGSVRKVCLFSVPKLRSKFELKATSKSAFTMDQMEVLPMKVSRSGEPTALRT